MTKRIPLDEALALVDFYYYPDTGWRVATVKGNCNTVAGNCDTVEGDCVTVEGNCDTVEGYCGTVKGDCGTVEGDCDTVQGDCGVVGGRVIRTINSRQWQYIETSKERMVRLIEEGASKEELLKALEALND